MRMIRFVTWGVLGSVSLAATGCALFEHKDSRKDSGRYGSDTSSQASSRYDGTSNEYGGTAYQSGASIHGRMDASLDQKQFCEGKTVGFGTSDGRMWQIGPDGQTTVTQEARPFDQRYAGGWNSSGSTPNTNRFGSDNPPTTPADDLDENKNGSDFDTDRGVTPMPEERDRTLLGDTPKSDVKTKSYVAVLRPFGEGGTVKGKVRFTQEGTGVRVVGEFEGLTANQKLGFHIHESGDPNEPGDHFNPTHVQHGLPDSSVHHVGDLGNLESDGGGKARFDKLVPNLTITGDDGILGRSVVVHSNADDGTTQPSGGSGEKLGVGVIGVCTKSEKK
jgi:Cu-Zn family superoxide dismutase